MTVSLVAPCAARIARAAIAILSLILLARTAQGDDPPRVRAVLHPRGTADDPVTFVDISVQGTEAPIRLVRRIDGACTVATDAPDGGALVAITCEAAATRFAVTREHQQIVVTRGSTGPNAEAQVIARAVLPAGTTDVQVDQP